MSSTTTTRAKSKKRKSQTRRRTSASTSRRAVDRSAPAFSIADWIAQGSGVEQGGLPGWKDLSSGKKTKRNRKKRARQVASRLSEVSTSRFALVLFVSALGLGLYVSHVFATQETLSLLEQQRRQHLKLELQYNQLKGQLDKKISPTIVYHRAKELGLEEGLAFEAPIQWELKEKE